MPARMLGVVAVAGLVGVGLVSPPASRGADPSPKADGSWAYTTPCQPPVPRVRDAAWVRNPIDVFVLAKLEAQGLAPSARADKLTLLRRVTFDLTGLPPTVAEQAAFLADASPDAYERVVDRLLASPRYGERWAQHWLDLVRYAETDGFKADDFRPNAHRYRDYVIRVLNADLPYDRFVRQQIAGDELEPGNPEALLATGLNRLYPDEYNAANLEQRRQEILDDITEVTGQVFLGLTVGCARCHDHKFDPIPQADFYRLQAFFAPMLPRDDLPAVDPRQKQQFAEQRVAWEKATESYRKELEALTAAKRAEVRKHALGKFRQEIQDCVLTPEARRTPYQQQIAAMAEKQLHAAEKGLTGKLPADKKGRCQALERSIEKVGPQPATSLPTAMAITDLGREAPPTYLLAGGDWRKPRKEVRPGFPTALGETVPDTRIDPSLPSTGRRAALARWLTSPDNPLTARVLVNRLWHHHFGAGIVATPNDFGAQGEPPTHSELLDWLALEFMGNGECGMGNEEAHAGLSAPHSWSLKHLHRLMVTSATYCQSSLVDRADPRHVKALAADRQNKLLWHARRHRLEGEALRDSLLALSGELNPRPFGPSARPELPDRISSYAWKPDANPEDRHRRSVYVLAKRNMRYPLFDAFDLPDMHNSCACRSKTTTAPQALLLLNGDFALDRARHWADRLLGRFGGDAPALVAHAYRAAWGRVATPEEVRAGLRFIEAQTAVVRAREPDDTASRAAAVADFCHAVLSANETLYVD